MSFFAIEILLYLIFAVPCSIFDLRIRYVPRILTLGAFIPYTIFLFVFSLNPHTFYSPILGLICTLLVYLVGRIFTGKSLGIADIIFGTFSGYFNGFPSCFFGILSSALLGLIFYVFSFLLKRKNSENVTRTAFGTFSIPFIPFICAGTLLVKVLAHFYY